MQAFLPPLALNTRCSSSKSSWQSISLTKNWACPSLRRHALNHAVIMDCARATIASSTSLSSEESQPLNATPSEIKNFLATSLDEMSDSARARIEGMRDQLEFWFSASNLRRDWYLCRQMDEDGWLDPSVFLMFNRTKKLKATLKDVVIAASLSDELEISQPSSSSFGDDIAQTRVRRHPSLPDFREWDDTEYRSSLIVKYIPHDSTVESIISIFESFAEVTYARIYRGKVSGASPRALVCFKDEETANRVFSNFASQAPEEAHGFVIRRRHMPPGSEGAESAACSSNSNSKESPRLVVMQISGVPSSIAWKELFNLLNEEFYTRCTRRPRFLLYNTGDTEGFVTIEDVSTVRDAISELTKSGFSILGSPVKVRMLKDEREIQQYWTQANAMKEERRKKRADRAAGKDSDVDENLSISRRPSGVVIKLRKLPPNATWKVIMTALEKFGNVVFINYKPGDSEGFLRAGSADDALTIQKILTAEDGVTICGTNVDAYILDGEEEKSYWKAAEVVQKSRLSKQKQVDFVSGENAQPVTEAGRGSR